MRFRVVALALAAVSLVACETAELRRADASIATDAMARADVEPDDSAPPTDLGPAADSGADGGTADLGPTDAGPPDTGPPDTGPSDAGDPCALSAASAPAAPRLLAPWNGATWGSALAPDSLQPRFRWREADRAGCYHVQWGTDCDAADLAACDLGDSVDAVTAALEHTPDEPLPVGTTVPVGTRYYWRVRACNRVDCSAWSEARYLDVGRLPDDLDGDGDSEVIVGCRACDAADGMAPFSGALLVYDGGESLDDSPFRFEGPTRQEFSRFGQSVAAGDLDGDGFADVVVGAPTELAPEPEAGAVYLLRGSAAGLIVAAGSVVRLTSPSPGRASGFFGAQLAIAGDVDGDGDRDVVVAAPGESPDGSYYSGALYLLRGTSTGLEATPEMLARRTLPPSSKAGFSVCGAGDLDGDGLSDVVAGAAGYTPGPDGRETGRLLVWHGAADGDLGLAAFVDPPDPMADDLFGSAVACGFDADDDGLSDVLVGADERNVRSGRVRIAFGDEDEPLVVGDACRSGLGPYSMFGSTVMSAGDVDHDGVLDLAAGAWAAGGPVFRVTYTNRTRPPICESWLPNLGGGRVYNGFSMARADVDGDGDEDLLIGAPAVGPYPDDPLPEAVYLYRSGADFDTTPTALPVPYPMGTRPQELGYSLD
ncbi:MAG: FG-GAP repeat protein [Deltaproteobacteria bacterium]|nr:FG-GAP repeat protein [Deltaproteobacteria bacterium]